IVKAYEQCRRFLEHLSSSEEVVLYRRVSGRFEELIRIRLGDYRLILPIGLTVESLSPFSTSSKQLPGVQPILGLHPFLSISIDEILVLRRFLPTSGELFHYFRIRQMAAGIVEALLFDELDHLGAYISKNVFTIDLERELAKGARMIVYDGAGDVIDDYFAEFDLHAVSPPVQEMPSELRLILAAVDQSRSRGFLKIDSALRDFGREGRMQVSGLLQPLR